MHSPVVQICYKHYQTTYIDDHKLYIYQLEAQISFQYRSTYYWIPIWFWIDTCNAKSTLPLESFTAGSSPPQLSRGTTRTDLDCVCFASCRNCKAMGAQGSLRRCPKVSTPSSSTKSWNLMIYGKMRESLRSWNTFRGTNISRSLHNGRIICFLRWRLLHSSFFRSCSITNLEPPVAHHQFMVQFWPVGLKTGLLYVDTP